MVFEGGKRMRTVAVLVEFELKLWFLNHVYKPRSRRRDRNGPLATYIGPRVTAYSPTTNSQDASHAWTPGPQQDATLLPRHEGEQHRRRAGEATHGRQMKSCFSLRVSKMKTSCCSLSPCADQLLYDDEPSLSSTQLFFPASRC